VPKAVVTALPPPVAPPPPVFRPGGLIYEAAVRPLTLLHPEIPETQRGTVAALAHPAMLRHLARLGVSAVELMPGHAWIDERHLARLGLSNGWGYNPVAMMALDPRLCPGGIEELRTTVRALRRAGIGVILDVVFNHTGRERRPRPHAQPARASTRAPTSATTPTGGSSTTRAAATRSTAPTRRRAASSSTPCAISWARRAWTASASTSPRSSAARRRASTRRRRCCRRCARTRCCATAC
jgi:hypothetical protein